MCSSCNNVCAYRSSKSGFVLVSKDWRAGLTSDLDSHSSRPVPKHRPHSPKTQSSSFSLSLPIDKLKRSACMHVRQTGNITHLTAIVQALCCRTIYARMEHLHYTDVVGRIWKASAEMHRGYCQAPIYSDNGRVLLWLSDGQLGKCIRLRLLGAICDLWQRQCVFVQTNSATSF